MRLWGGRFAEPSDQRMIDFTRSIEVDAALAADDIAGSIAHVRGLGRAGLLTDEEVEALVAGLTALAGDIAAGLMTWDPSLEDVHLNLEAALAEKVGPVAGKLHTGRSRNDQVATDLRLWTRRAIDDLDAALIDVRAIPGRHWPSARGRPSFPARPTSSRPSPCSWRITCWPTSRWPSATAAGWPMPAGASTSRRSGPGRWPAPGIRSTGRPWRPSSGSTG